MNDVLDSRERMPVKDPRSRSITHAAIEDDEESSYTIISKTTETRVIYPRSRSITHTTGGGYGMEETDPRNMSPVMYPRSRSITHTSGNGDDGFAIMESTNSRSSKKATYPRSRSMAHNGGGNGMEKREPRATPAKYPRSRSITHTSIEDDVESTYTIISTTTETRVIYPRSRSITHTTGGGFWMEETEPQSMSTMSPRSTFVTHTSGSGEDESTISPTNSTSAVCPRSRSMTHTGSGYVMEKTDSRTMSNMMYPRSRSITHTGGEYGMESANPASSNARYPRSRSITHTGGGYPHTERSRGDDFSSLLQPPVTANRDNMIAALKPPSRDTPVGKNRRSESQLRKDSTESRPSSRSAGSPQTSRPAGVARERSKKSLGRRAMSRRHSMQSMMTTTMTTDVDQHSPTCRWGECTSVSSTYSSVHDSSLEMPSKRSEMGKSISQNSMSHTTDTTECTSSDEDITESSSINIHPDSMRRAKADIGQEQSTTESTPSTPRGRSRPLPPRRELGNLTTDECVVVAADGGICLSRMHVTTSRRKPMAQRRRSLY